MLGERRSCELLTLYVPVRSVFQQFTPLLQVLKPATGLAVVVATVAGKPRAHSSAVPECVKPAAPLSKSVLKTVCGRKPGAHAGGGGTSQIRRLQDVSVPPLAPACAFVLAAGWALVPLPAATAKDRTIVLKADGGRAPLTWLVNGQLLGNFDRFQPVLYSPDGEGMARFTVVDAQGRSDTAQVRFKKMR